MLSTILYIQPYTSGKIVQLSNLSIATMVNGYGLIEKGSVSIENGVVTHVGTETAKGDAIDCGGRLLTPGLIDCHTHLVYGGNR